MLKREFHRQDFGLCYNLLYHGGLFFLCCVLVSMGGRCDFWHCGSILIVLWDGLDFICIKENR